VNALPDLPLEAWEPTRNTLHLWCQIVGKVKLATTHPLNHWWNVPLHVAVRGLTTRRLVRDDVSFRIDFDFLSDALRVSTDRGDAGEFALRDGLSVAEFDRNLHSLLSSFGVDVEIVENPFETPISAVPFPEDAKHASYDAEFAQRFWRALEWTDDVLTEFSGWFCGKQSPVHLFWHSLDLALTRFSGGRAAPPAGVDAVTREAYSHEVISFGFWPGDARTPFAAFYSYTAPEPSELVDEPLEPEAASWQPAPYGGHLAVLPYDTVRAADDPRSTLLSFLQSAYEAGARTAGWGRDELASTWCPTPSELQRLSSR
jgi:Family of unknown function (DUF5996)